MTTERTKVRANVNAHEADQAYLNGLQLDAFNGLRPPYPIRKRFHFSAVCNSEQAQTLLTKVAESEMHATENGHLLVRRHAVILVSIAFMKEYCTIHGTITAESVEHAAATEAALFAPFEGKIVEEAMFRLLWHITLDKGESRAITVEEKANDVLYDACYPHLPGTVHDFATRYIESEESVLVVIGPPGTGKTRLIRYILGEMARRQMRMPHAVEDQYGDPLPPMTRRPAYDMEKVTAVYTNDDSVLSKGKIFADFLVGDASVLIIEDADHMLKARSSGNDKMHFFLAAADGIIRAQGRKIIFSTNLPNISDVDEALIRPGRCFAITHLSALNLEQARAAALAISGYDGFAFPKNVKEGTLAEVYKWCREREEADRKAAAKEKAA